MAIEDQIMGIKESIKDVLRTLLSLPENSRELALVKTKLEEACMWADYDLRLRGVDPHAKDEPEVEYEDDDDEEEEDPADLVSNM